MKPSLGVRFLANSARTSPGLPIGTRLDSTAKTRGRRNAPLIPLRAATAMRAPIRRPMWCQVRFWAESDYVLSEGIIAIVVSHRCDLPVAEREEHAERGAHRRPRSDRAEAGL